ncbi:MAG: response regulator transcription factor [Anaerolineales bacterium]|nr:response regulator transcription factor [Anaerolineales bacterium]
MSKPQILLISSQRLFGESLEMILRAEKEVELMGVWNPAEEDVSERLMNLQIQPAVVVIADEALRPEAVADLTRLIMERYPEISVIRTALNENIFRLFSTYTLPARGDRLLEAIRLCAGPNRELVPMTNHANQEPV